MTRPSLRPGLRPLFVLLATTALVAGLRFDAREADWNLNTNRHATNPLDYDGRRGDGFKYTKSPTNWRVPFYTLFLDRFVNGDPGNDDNNGTVYETDMMSTQIRFGGDLEGLRDSLDYIVGMGIKALYIAGSPFINLPWGADAYSPIDLTLVDKHFGTVKLWQDVIDEVHQRGMMVVLDNTMGTMGDLIGFEGFLNESTPFRTEEHKTLWKSSTRYPDFDIGNEYNSSCAYPQFWDEDGTRIDPPGLKGCYNSDFAQYGDIEAFGVFPDWQRQLAKFASVQDRLRVWESSVAARLEHFSCLAIRMLDIDGFRIDKAAQVTVDAQASFSTAMRKCAKGVGKDNFIVLGEITSGNTLGSIYLGRGREPHAASKLDLVEAMNMTPPATGTSGLFIRDAGNSALDGGAFHYSIYRSLTHFLGLSGNLEAGYDLPLEWVDSWNHMVRTNDFFNAQTNKFDPRHLYGATNQDVFRWPAIEQGVERMLLAYFITTILMPGAPLVYYGEEQALYALDGTASNYVYGRQAFAPSPAWQAHGCFGLTIDQYKGWPITKGRDGCRDETVAWDHRDPSAPVRNIFRHMFALRDAFPVLEHGWLLENLAKNTTKVFLNGSTTASEFGIWSVARGMFTAVQREKDAPVWLVYHNRPNRTTYESNCRDATSAFISPFDAGSEVKNLFSQDKAIKLENSVRKNNFTGTGKNAGCLSKITLEPYEFRAYVQTKSWVQPAPMITKFEPGHDFHLDSTHAEGVIDGVAIEFNVEMDCNSVAKALSAVVITDGMTAAARLSFGKIDCKTITPAQEIPYVGAIQSTWRLETRLVNVPDGIVKITVGKVASKQGISTNATDHFLIRFGKRLSNPVVFPTANYSRSLLSVEKGTVHVQHSAPGATQWRYSTTWGSQWSPWKPYDGSKEALLDTQSSWRGTELQKWDGKHLTVQYYSKPLGSSAFIQHADSSDIEWERGLPHVNIHGPHNKWGYDAGLPGSMDLVRHHTWELHYMCEWPAHFQLNVWGINPDGQPDAGAIYGDVDNDGVVDRLPPSSLAKNVINITGPPPMPALAYKLIFNDATWRFEYQPTGHIGVQILIFVLLAVLPIVSAMLAGWVYVRSFYQVKVNKAGLRAKAWISLDLNIKSLGKSVMTGTVTPPPPPSAAMTPFGVAGGRRTVLMATMEYNIDDFGINIKIGGLGVMAKLMGSALAHIDLIWVVPMVGDVEYPTDRMTQAESMFVKVMGQPYEIGVYYYTTTNITFVLLDAPIFRKQTKANPYIARMDDIESAVLYAAWNSCIAETIRRFPVDIYHINDYHGAAAPLYLLPQTIPCCLSLHNAEFQGMWPMRTPEEQKEVCEVFNLPPEIVRDYVQYGSVFNLLHAGASYLRIHQRGFGAVGVSRKYGDRSLARYPIFWSLKNIGQLPNPDPSDTAEWSPTGGMNRAGTSDLDQANEEKRANLRRQAQEWAGLEIDPEAELFVFVGRWSLQKGVDLIADIFPGILDKYPKTQLICVGPVIDLYGRFAALKLQKLMEKYPKRVFSKPEFTQLPPCIFSGAEFALIPSRDEPFGLVAVEFGRKGALGVGARVGGLGQMPGFWYTVESMTPSHLLQQFRQAIVSALDCKPSKRALMRSWSAKQRFPVAQWIQQLDQLYSESIRVHDKEARKRKLDSLGPVPGRSRPPSPPSSFSSSATCAEPGSASIYSPAPETSSANQSPVTTPTAAWPLINNSNIPTLPFPRRAAVSAALSDPAAKSKLSVDSTSTARASTASLDSFGIRTQRESVYGLAPPRPLGSSPLSLPDVVGDRQDFKLQQVDQFFNDGSGEYYAMFEEMLDGLNAQNSTGDLCIETFLKKSEKEWFARYRDAKLGRRVGTAKPVGKRDESRDDQRRDESSVSRGRRRHRSATSSNLARSPMGMSPGPPKYTNDEFLLGDGYQAPTGVKKILSIRLGDWPVYSFLLAFGQIISVSSYQIVLLTGETSQSAERLYMIAGTYMATTLVWWAMERNFKSVYALSAPWFFYGLAFMFIGIAPLVHDRHVGSKIGDAASCFYAAGASSGILSFALNFGDEGGTPTKQWITRALTVSGLAQIYTIGLWYWGSIISSTTTTPTVFLTTSTIPRGVAIGVPLALLLWAVGVTLYLGLPDCYRQAPASIPGFYISLYRRRVVPWFLAMAALQNYWLSAQYGRSWQFLFASQHVPRWGVLLLALGFYVGLWAGVLRVFARLADAHTWLLPIFAIGLCTPRWAQEFWGTSGIGWYLPWAGGPVWSAVVSRCLWLWLGVLDNIQGVGLGMLLLATLTRHHVVAVLVGAQVVGSVFTMLGRATSPNELSPHGTFPDFSQGVMPGLVSPFFWVCLLLQLVIPVGFFKFFRKEQISKP